MSKADGPRDPNLPSDDKQKSQQTAEELRALAEWEEAEEARVEEERLLAVEEMIDWFTYHFQDPQNETPRDDGEFIYIWGGPFDASEILHDHFHSRYDDDLIDEAVRELEAEGIIEWAPTSYGDFYEHPAQNDNNAAPNSKVTRESLIAAIGELREQLAHLETAPASIGHNRPPDEIEAVPFGEDDKREVLTLLSNAEDQIVSGKPNTDKLQSISSKLGHYAAKAIKYAASKVDLAIDESIKKGVPISMAYFAFGNYLQSFIENVSDFFGF